MGLATVRLTPVSQYLTEEWLTATLHELRGSWWGPVGLVVLYVVLCPMGMPASPLMITGGAVFGVAKGTVVNFGGTFLAALASFWFARGLGHDLVVHLLGHRLKQVEGFLRKHGFWTLVRLRFLPVPFAVTNYGAALAGVRFSVFLTATALGLAPTMLVFSYFASAVVTAAEGERSGVFRNLFFAVCLMLALTFVPALWRAWNRRRQPPEVPAPDNASGFEPTGGRSDPDRGPP